MCETAHAAIKKPIVEPYEGEGLWIVAGFTQEAVDGGLQFDDRAEHAALKAAAASAIHTSCSSR